MPAAFQRGIAALAQYLGREGSGSPVPRSHVEPVVVQSEHHEVKLGIWISNTKTRRTKLSAVQRAMLTELGVDWAEPTPVTAAATGR
ncbi:helicase associated domain-containing protein [Streptomyces sp. NBC_00212]|uniref:helicase associated domain-containing protein n=1 Tax=Streptomyces sp. NBC_00212 TaxID=2975684 RepID=UPI0032475E8E